MEIHQETTLSEVPEDIISLREMVRSLVSEKQSWEKEKVFLKQDIMFLREQVNILLAKRYGRSSEKYDDSGHVQLQFSIFDEAEEIESAEPEDPTPEKEAVPGSTPKRKKRGRRPLPDWLPRVEKIYDLPESERTCDLDGSTLVEIGRESSEQLDIIPAKVQVIRHVHVKYGCPHCRQGIKTAPTPRRPFPKALATAALLAHVVVSKYADGMPLYRQGNILGRAGIDIPRSTLANWMIKAGGLVQPLINLFRDHLLDYGIVQMDETTVQVLKEPNKPATSKSYMWVQRGGPPDKQVLLFDYDASRSGSVPIVLLADYKGYLQTDGYSGYLAVAADPDIIHLGCWAHVRRKFDEAVKAIGKGAKGKAGQAGRALALIRKLYAIEKILREEKADVQTRFIVRNEQARSILTELKSWLDKTLPTVPPKSALGKALNYMANQWPGLLRYLDDGRLEIDNNGVENAIRPFVVGRKGWLFSASVRGVKSSANLYSLIETAKANGLEPFVYLQHIFTQLPLAQTVEDFENLLPWNVDRAALSTD